MVKNMVKNSGYGEARTAEDAVYFTIGKHRPLQKHEQLELIKTYQTLCNSENETDRRRAKRAKDKLVVHSLGLINTCINKKMVQTYKIPFTDLVADGAVGIIKAIEKFDFSKETCFSTYAVWWIKAELIRAVCKLRSAVSLPPYVHSDYAKIKQAMSELTELKKPVTYATIADQCDRPEYIVRRTLEAMQDTVSLDVKLIGEDGRPMSSYLEVLLRSPDGLEALELQSDYDMLNLIEPTMREHLNRCYVTNHDQIPLSKFDKELAKSNGLNASFVKRKRVEAVKKLAQLLEA